MYNFYLFLFISILQTSNVMVIPDPVYSVFKDAQLMDAVLVLETYEPFLMELEPQVGIIPHRAPRVETWFRLSLACLSVSLHT